MDVGEVYLILLRPSRVPVAGEAVAQGFQGQVQLHDWRWTLHNPEELQRLAGGTTASPEGDTRRRCFEFAFSKRVDLASTQMLNAMKAGDTFGSGTLTIHQRSVNSGLTLVINLQKVRLLDYRLRVEVSDTMTDLVETWTAEFAAMGYSYKNRNAVGSSVNAVQAGLKAATQGTVRAFVMQDASLMP